MRPLTVPWMTRSSSPEISPSMTIELPMTVCAPARGAGTFSMPAIRPFLRPGIRAAVRCVDKRKHWKDRGRLRGASTSGWPGALGEPGHRFLLRLLAPDFVQDLVSEAL